MIVLCKHIENEFGFYVFSTPINVYDENYARIT